MDWDDDEELSAADQKQKRPKKSQSETDPDEDEGTLEYAERPAFVAMDVQESVFDRGSLNRQHGINTKPSVFESTWKPNTHDLEIK